jgi:putative transposase
VATRTSGSEGGPGRRTGRKADTAPRADPYAEKVRDGGRVVNKCVVIAYGVHETGRREILGIDVGAAETEAFWTEFLRSLVGRGLAGVQLVVSDAHEGLKQAIARVLACPWQRCPVHFLRDCLGHARRDQHDRLGALIRPIFQADSGEQARDRLSEAVAHLDGKLPKVAALLEQAEDDILAFYSFPAAHWSKLRSTNPLERFNKEIGRRTDVVGIFPDDRSLIRLVGMLCLEQNDEWLVGRRYLSAAAMEPLLEQRLHRESTIDHEEVRELTPTRAAKRLPTNVSANSHTTSRDLTRIARSLVQQAARLARSENAI